MHFYFRHQTASLSSVPFLLEILVDGFSISLRSKLNAHPASHYNFFFQLHFELVSWKYELCF